MMEYLLKPTVHLDEAQRRQSEQIAAAHSLDRSVSDLLVARGINSGEEARRFLKPEQADLLDPFLFRDMETAVSLIRETIAAGGKIWIHGDYDADGTSAAALLQRALRRMGAVVECKIPDRTDHGYGLALDTVEGMAGAAMLITVDCGITSVHEISRARELGLKTIVTDHHTPPELLPEPDALLNPKAEGETYPFADLCGAGIAFKLAQALIGEEALELLDLAAFGTVADVVPLVGENRTLVALGLEKFNRDPNPGLDALYAPHRERRGPLTADGIAFQLAPSVNAAGRMASARLALELMTVDQRGAAAIVAATLQKLNEERQRRQREIAAEVQSRLAAMETLPDFIVLSDPAWETGLVGVAASTVCERYGRPALLLGGHKGQFCGSCRSTEDVNVYEALKSAEALLVKFGGHAAAAGLTVEAENIQPLEAALNAFAAGKIRAGGPTEAEYDLEVTLPVEIGLISELDVLEPCGCGNPHPRILLRQADISDVRALAGGEHAAFSLHTAGGRLDAVQFRQAAEDVPPQADVIGTLGINSFRGNDAVQMIVETLSVEDQDDALFSRLAHSVCQPKLPADAWNFRCGKPRLGLIYSAVKQLTERRGPLSWRQLYRGGRRLIPDLSPQQLVFAVCVFTQLKLLAGTKDAKITTIASSSRRRLEDSPIFCRFEEPDDGSESQDSRRS